MKTMIGTAKNFAWLLAVQIALAIAFLPSPANADQTLKKFRPNYNILEFQRSGVRGAGTLKTVLGHL